MRGEVLGIGQRRGWDNEDKLMNASEVGVGGMTDIPKGIADLAAPTQGVLW